MAAMVASIRGSDVRGMQIMYGMRGERHLPECVLPWLRGYKGSGPVRIGNSASEQLQLDVFGEVADAIVNMVRSHISLDVRTHRLQRALTEHVARICHQRASAIWERREHQDHFTYSKMMAWLALDHGIKACGERDESLETKAESPPSADMQSRVQSETGKFCTDI
jgi:GH15 family glucan-1,4-alpha-glucosidase